MSQKPKFATPFAMKCNYEQFESVKDRLFEMGYILNQGIPHKWNHIVTNYGGCGHLFGLHNQNKESQPILIEEWNEELCLALAAMTDQEPKNEYIKGEWLVCVKNTIEGEKIGDFYKTEINHKFNPNYWRKATSQELISHFTKEREKEEVIGVSFVNPVTKKTDVWGGQSIPESFNSPLTIISFTVPDSFEGKNYGSYRIKTESGKIVAEGSFIEGKNISTDVNKKERVITPESEKAFEKKTLQPGETFSYAVKSKEEVEFEMKQRYPKEPDFGENVKSYSLDDGQNKISVEYKEDISVINFIKDIGKMYFGTSGAYMPSHQIKVIKENGEIVGVRVDVDTAEPGEPEFEEKEGYEAFFDLPTKWEKHFKETMERQSKVPDYREAYNKLSKHENELVDILLGDLDNPKIKDYVKDVVSAMYESTWQAVRHHVGLTESMRKGFQ